MPPLVIQQEQEAVRIPPWVDDLASFRRWAKSAHFPHQGWYAHLNGELWVDPSMERLGHNKVKGEFNAVLTRFAKSEEIGQFLGDRMLLTNFDAELSTEPDGMFVSHAAFRSGRVILGGGEDSSEVEGSPDMVLEVVRPSSRQKDRVVLRGLYYRAGVREYWIAESIRNGVTFEILRRGTRGFIASKPHDGWVKSAVFNQSFRLVQTQDVGGFPQYTLEMR